MLHYSQKSALRTLKVLLQFWLAFVLLAPVPLAHADRAEELLGVKQIEPPVRRAIDQNLDDPSAKGRGVSAQLSGDASSDAGASSLDLLSLIFKINQSLAIELETTAAAANAASATPTEQKKQFKGLNAQEIKILKAAISAGAVGPWKDPQSAEWREANRNPKESMLKLLESVNTKLAKLFSELGLPSDHEVLKKAKLKIAAAQQAVVAQVKTPSADARKKEKIGKPMLPVVGGKGRDEHFQKRIHAAVHGSPHASIPTIPESKIHPPAVEVPTEKAPGVAIGKIGALSEKVTAATAQSPQVPSRESLTPSIDQKIDPKINQLELGGPKVDQHVSIDVDDITQRVNKHLAKVSPKVDTGKQIDADSLRPDVDEDGVDVSGIEKKVDAVTDGVQKDVSVDVGDVRQDVSNKVDGIKKSVDSDVTGVSKDVTKDVDGVEKNIDQSIKENVDPIKENVEESVNKDVAQVRKKVQESVDESGLEKSIEDRLSNKLKGDLESVRKKCVAATNQAYAGVKKYLNKEISKQKSALIKKYKGWWWDIDYEDGRYREPNTWPNWGDDVRTYKKYYGARQQVDGDQISSVGNINSVFAAAESNLAVGNQGAAPSTSDAGRSPDAPKRKQQRVPGEGDDHEVIEIDGSFTETAIVPLEVVASIGDNSVALAELGTVGAEEDSRIRGSVNETITAPGVITAALGYETDAFLRLGTIDADVDGSVRQKVVAPALIVAAIGGSSDAIANVGTLRGTIGGAVSQDITVPSSVVAAIGGDTTARLDVGTVADDVRVGGKVNQKITLRSPTIDAAIGYRSNAITSIGTVNADVGGSVNQDISVGGIVNAAIGSHTDSTIAIGDISSRVTGNVKQNISTGEILNATIGAGTKANTEVGTIRAPVYGNVDMNIHTGSFLSASVGVHTVTEAMVGTIQAPVHGNLTSNIHTGDITNFAIGIGVGSGTEISAKTYVGNVFTPIHGSRNINISTGSIFTFGFGLDIDLGPLGELRIIIDGCNGAGTSLGNIGGPC